MALLNVGQLAGRLQMLLNEQVDYQEARSILDDHYRSMFTDNKWSFSKTETRLTTRAAKTAGTVAVVQDSPTVAGTATAFANTDVGSFIALPDGRYYEIGAVDVGLQTLTLGTPTATTNFVGTTATGQDYTLFLHRYTLDTDVESIISIAATSWTLEEKRQLSLNDVDPQRIVYGEPTSYAYIDPDPTTGYTRIELWPIPSVAYSFPYVGLKRGSLDTASQLVNDLSEALLYISAATASNVVFAKTGKEHWASVRDYYGGMGQERLRSVKKRDRRRFGKDDFVSRTGWNRFIGATNVDWGPWGRW